MVNRYWQIDNVGTNDTADVTFTYASSEQVANGNTGMIAQRWSGTKWQLANTFSGQTNPTAFSVKVPNVPDFSPWAISMLSNPLPVELINFSGKYLSKRSVIQLNWQTASELNCAYFEVERMKADGTFEYVGTVDCNGTTNLLNSYTLDDPNYIIGNNYYRLKQVDDNGNIAYSKLLL